MVRRMLLAGVCAAVSSVFAESVFEERSVESARLTAAESERYEMMKRMPGVVRAKLIAIDEKALSRATSSEMSFFDGAKQQFQVTSTASGAWKGRVEGSDRFVLRSFDGNYSGHLLINGRSLVLTPVKPGLSVLYELGGAFECGMDALEMEQK